MKDNVKWGNYTVDFQCNELAQEVTVSNVRAASSEDAEYRAKFSLSQAFTWRCTGIDRDGDWR